MKTNEPENVGGGVDTRFESTQKNFQSALSALENFSVNVEAGDLSEIGQLGRITQDLIKARNLVLTELQKLDDEDRQRNGRVQEHALNLEHARTEIKRRMDRLRTTAHPGEIPE